MFVDVENEVFDYYNEELKKIGFNNPNKAWILTEQDVWKPNPYYVGPSVPHPKFEEF
jgi:hypothetical protein